MYDGDGAITATNTGDADIPTITFHASQSVSGVYYPNDDSMEFSIGGAPEGPLCDIGLRVYLSGPPPAGPKAYTPVSSQVHDDPVAFHMGDNAFLELGCNGDCQPPAPEEWDSIDGAMGSVKIESVVGHVVTLSFTSVTVVGVMNMMANGKGTIILDGSAHSDCFQF